MWKRLDSGLDDITKPNTSPSIASVAPSRTSALQSSVHGSTTVVDQSVVIIGELKGNEDLTIEGRVEGIIESKKHMVTIGANGTAKAKISAKDVIVFGNVDGNITASSKVEIRPTGTVAGDIVSPTVAIAEGATFRGSIDMSRSAGESAA